MFEWTDNFDPNEFIQEYSSNQYLILCQTMEKTLPRRTHFRLFTLNEVTGDN